MRYLKQSTSVDVGIGPFLDETDGKTAETALTITQPDVRLKKNGGAWAQKAAAQTLSHEENGWYEVTLDATDTDTIGHLLVAVHESGALPVWAEFHVLAANVYDSLFGAATDKLDVNVEEWNTTPVPAEHTAGYPIVTVKDGTGTGEINTNAGAVALVDLVTTTTTATNVTTVNGLAANVITATAIQNDAITAAKIAAGAIDAATFAADVDAEILSYLVDDATRIDASALNTATATTIPTINTAVGGLQTTLQGLVLYSGTIGSTGNDTTHVHLEIPAGVGNDEINGLVVVLFDTSVGVYNVRHVTDWVAATQLATLDSALPAAPQNATDLYWLLSADLGRVYTRLGAPAGASLAADLAAIEAQTDDIGTAGAGLTAVPWNAAWDAEVQSEVQDAIEANNLDHLLKIAVDTDFPTTVHLNSVIGYLADNGTSASYDRTTDSLEVLGAATAPSAASIADAVWEEAIADHSGTSGSTAEALNAAGSAGDPWVTALPGSYTSGQAGHTIGTYLTGNAFTRLGAPAGASVSADVAAVKAETATILSDTNDIQTRLPAALVSGRMDASVGAMAANTLTASALAADAVAEIQSGLSTHSAADVWAAATRTLTSLDEDSTTLDLDATVRAAVGLASANLDTQLDALPTAAEVTTAVWAAGTRTLTSIDEDVTTLDLDATIAAAAPTAAAIADAILGRNVAGGSSTGRTVSQALFALRNKVTISGGTMTVYSTDDTTSSWTATVTSDAAADPITAVDPG